MSKNHKRLSSFLIPLVVVLLNVLILVFPKEVVKTANEGVRLWLGNVLPSLLPFIIGTNLMSALGVTRLMGKIAEPVMKKLFKLPGSCGFVVAVGLISGYPMGARAASSLRENGDISKQEADRLICFVNNSGPLFILGAVGQGMFDSVLIGYYILTVHYISALLTGFLFSLSGKNTPVPDTPMKKKETKTAKPIHSKSFGTILSGSVANGMETILSIGGFIILFSVVSRILEITNVYGILAGFVTTIFHLKNISPELLNGSFTSIIEVTNGLKTISASGISKETLIIAVCAVSFGGLSIHAQSISFISKTDINAGCYLLSKLVHTALSVIIGFIALPFFYKPIINSEAVTAFKVFSNNNSIAAKIYNSSLSFAFFAAITFVLPLAAYAVMRLTKPRHKKRGIIKPNYRPAVSTAKYRKYRGVNR